MPAHPATVNRAAQRDRHAAHRTSLQHHALKRDGWRGGGREISDDKDRRIARRRAHTLDVAPRCGCAQRRVRQKHCRRETLILFLDAGHCVQVFRDDRLKATSSQRCDCALDGRIFDARQIIIFFCTVESVLHVMHEHATGRALLVIKANSSQRARPTTAATLRAEMTSERRTRRVCGSRLCQ